MLANGRQLNFGLSVVRNLFNHIEHWNTDDGFEPHSETSPTYCPPGSPEKLEVLTKRIENGEPLWHDADKQTEVGSRYSLLLGLLDGGAD